MFNAVLVALVASIAVGADAPNTAQMLRQPSEFDFSENKTPLCGLPFFLSAPEQWGVAFHFDREALNASGIALENITSPQGMRTIGVDRRSALRFLLESSGLGYIVEDNRIVITTKQIARGYWTSTLTKPKLENFPAKALDQRRDQVFSVAHFQLNAEDWVPLLTGSLESDDVQIRFDAAFALGGFGPEASEAVDPLITLLRSKDRTLQCVAAFALGRIGPVAIVRLCRVLDDRDEVTVCAAARALSVMGRRGRDCLPRLIAAGERHSNSRDCCEIIAEAISLIDPSGAVDDVKRMLSSQEKSIRSFGAIVGAYSKDYCDGLGLEFAALLHDSDLQVRQDGARALAAIELPFGFPVAALEKGIYDEDHAVRIQVRAAVFRLTGVSVHPDRSKEAPAEIQNEPAASKVVSGPTVASHFPRRGNAGQRLLPQRTATRRRG